ncbi:MAG: PTS lactose/cellobiose transporter subunit IIA [Campylobacteraceae bacterium]|jgi:hypothetical protein|nr:PTS lactose/cellobiose transporter subunit IIA [Campylobacteraceae bacterium]
MVGCSNAGEAKSSSAKSVQYYKKHWDEAEKKIDSCEDWFDAECANAYEGRYSKGQLTSAQKMQISAENYKKRPKDSLGIPIFSGE